MTTGSVIVITGASSGFGALTARTLALAGHTVEAEYETKYPGLLEQVAVKLAALAPEGVDASLVSDEIARIVALPAGERPYRVHIDPANDGSEAVSEVADRIRREFLTRFGLGDLLTAK